MSGPNLHVRTALAGGNIRRSRVLMNPGTEFGCVEMSTNLSFPPIGIALPHTRQVPGTPFDTSLYLAVSGQDVPYWGVGAIGYAECGGTVTGGKKQTVDSTARIVDSTNMGANSFGGTQWNVCRALENGTTGDLVRVEVIDG